MDLKADKDCCEEAALLPPGMDFYAPCNKPAIYIVGWKGRSDKPIQMCEACANHNVKRRGGEIVKLYRKEEANEAT